MKKILRDLQQEHFKAYLVWSYLWLGADDKNICEFCYTDVCFALKMSRSAVSRIVCDIDQINRGKVYAEVTHTGKGSWVKFYDRGKPQRKADPLFDSAVEYMKAFYEQLDYTYADFQEHKKYLRTLLGKLEKSIKAKEGENVTDTRILEALTGYTKSLPKWWIETGNITMRQLSGKYTQIVGAIRKENKKKYATEIMQREGSDFAHLVKNGK